MLRLRRSFPNSWTLSTYRLHCVKAFWLSFYVFITQHYLFSHCNCMCSLRSMRKFSYLHISRYFDAVPLKKKHVHNAEICRVCNLPLSRLIWMFVLKCFRSILCPWKRKSYFIPFDKQRISEDVLEVTVFFMGRWVLGCGWVLWTFRVEGSDAFLLTCVWGTAYLAATLSQQLSSGPLAM